MREYLLCIQYVSLARVDVSMVSANLDRHGSGSNDTHSLDLFGIKSFSGVRGTYVASGMWYVISDRWYLVCGKG